MPEAATVTVESAHVEVVGGVAYASGGVTIHSPDGLFQAESAALDLATGRVIGDGVMVSVCDCPGPDPWSVSARHVEFVPDEVVRFRGGWLRVLDRRLPPAPVPFSGYGGLLSRAPERRAHATPSDEGE